MEQEITVFVTWKKSNLQNNQMPQKTRDLCNSAPRTDLFLLVSSVNLFSSPGLCVQLNGN